VTRAVGRGVLAAGAVALYAIALPGCGPAGTTRSATESPMTTFRLSSTAFVAGGSIPSQYTCDGADVSPDLSWEGAPDGTAAFVLVVDDPDARGFVHWIAYDLTGSATGGLAEGIATSPDAPPQGTNDFGRVGWGGPCPPSGEHRYVFRLLALDEELGLSGAPRAADVLAATEGHVVGEARLEASYRRAG
jgi:hypothetical protein